MSIKYEILVEGNSLSFKGGFFGFATIVLIQAPDQAPILFDTGHHSTRLLLLEALKKHNLKPSDIGKVFLSHLHFDHANNIELFPNAEIYVSKAEWEYAHMPHKDDPFCSPSTNDFLARQKINFISATNGELVPGLFYRHAPGHTPGSYILHFKNQKGQTVVIAGDACKTYRELASLSAGHTFDPDNRSNKTLQWIADNADIVVPGHFPQMHKTDRGWLWDQPSKLELIIR